MCPEKKKIKNIYGIPPSSEDVWSREEFLPIVNMTITLVIINRQVVIAKY
jgi:hypothetical protein